MSDDYVNDIKLDQSVSLADSASSLRWYQNPQMSIFAGTFWDKTIRIFEVTQANGGPTIVQKVMSTLPVAPTCSCWNADCTALYVGCVDGTIKMVDVNTMNVTDVGKHNASISNVHFVPQQNILISTAFENSINFWQGSPQPVLSVDVLNKVFVSDYKNGILAGGTCSEKIFVIDMATVTSGTKTILDSVDLGKFSQIESVSLDNKGESIGLATVDGRANISTLAKNAQGFKMNPIITFKSNKTEENGSVILYPVNAVDFNSAHENWFMTAGSDGVMSFWDYKARNKIKSFSFGGNPICSASTSPAGNMLVYANGNDWHIGN